MLYITERPAEQCLEMLEAQRREGTGCAVIYCHLSHTNRVLFYDRLEPLLADILQNLDGAVYVLKSGDLVISWKGKIGKVRKAVINLFTTHYDDALKDFDPDDIFYFFDTHTHYEELLELFGNSAQKSKETTPRIAAAKKTPTVYVPTQVSFSPAQLEMLKKASATRGERERHEILIVEDQEFSQKLLLGMLTKHYTCHVAKNAAEAVNLYARYAPDITMLDIEMPGVNGHELAAILKTVDPQSHIIMVSGNHFVKDIEIAKANKVQGFIVKPYNKSKIMEAVAAFNGRKN